MPHQPPRLIDLHTDWLLQYAPESTLYGPERYPRVAGRLPQAEGYLGATSAAVVACYRNAEDWAARPDPWRALADLIARIEAEFSGRLLIGPVDFERWQAEPDALTWAVLGVEGFDFLVRGAADLDRLPALFDRGVRVFQPTYSAQGLLAGSSQPGDERGLTDLGRAFLETLAGLAPGPAGPRVAVDLAHLNPPSAADVLTWLEGDPGRTERLLPLYSHGTIAHAGFATPRAISLENLRRLRALGGVVGIGVSPPFHETPDTIAEAIDTAASIPFLGRAGHEGIAIGTDFLGVDRTLPELATAPDVISWVAARYPADMAEALIAGNGRAFLARITGAA